MIFRRSCFPGRALAVLCVSLPLAADPLAAQVAVPVGAGSYASAVPVSEHFEDSYYGLPAAQVEPVSATPAIFSTLHLDPLLAGKALPTNQWWTDLLIGNRSSLPTGSDRYNLQQDAFGGTLWFYPGAIDPQSYGLDVYFPNAWNAPNANGSPQGAINKGPSLQVRGAVPYTIPAGDVLIADFESGYPAGSVITNTTGTAFTATPSAGSGLTGMMGLRCASTRDNGDGPKGSVRLADFTVAKQYLHFKICGGNTAATQVRLVVGGQTVLAASGQNSLTFRWVTWDLTAWAGMTARVEIADESSGAWGIICCDQVVASNAADPTSRFGGDFTGTGSVVTGWGDWNVDFGMPDSSGNRIDVSVARGIPFTWTRWTGSVQPKIMLSGATLYNAANNPITVTGGSFTASSFAFDYQGRSYGVFLPDNTTVTVAGSYLQPQLSGANNYMVIGYLPAKSNLAAFAAAAYARPTNTQLDWTHDPAGGVVNTIWNITTTPMKGANLDTIQGWLPHHYRTTTHSLTFEPFTYLTPRGTMKCATGRTFQLAFPFKGITPALPAPQVTAQVNPYQPARMGNYLNTFNPGGMLGDTYWGGKALALCAQNMWFAHESGDVANTNRLQASLRTAMANWLTYTPGEREAFFADYPNWHALIGSNASYGSQAFNDLHFHYGYFAVAGATLGMVNPQFLTDYGPMLTKVAKCYGNWERTDPSQPFLRTFDIWAGHSNAGGMSSGNGNNQESSSEAMQSWAGLFLLGGALENDGMQAAGAMGFAMESCAVNEYWQDIHDTNHPPGYTREGTGILTADSYAYATYFSGDPAWVYGIQYVPSQHWLNYLNRSQPATVAAKWQAMWTERANYCASFPPWDAVSAFPAGKWVKYGLKVYSAKGIVPAGNAAPDVNAAQWQIEVDGSRSEPDILTGGLGHCLLVYQGLWDPETAVAEFDSYFTAGKEIATNATDAGSSYYLIHASRQLGNQDYNFTTGIPTSAVYLNPTTGVRTFVVYNPRSTTQPAAVYQNGVVVGNMTIPGRSLVSTTNLNYQPTAPQSPTGLTAISGNGATALGWSASATATGYHVKRATVSGGPYTTVASPTTPGYSDTTNAPGVTYFYVVSALNSLGESANSSEASVTAFGPPLMAVNCGSSTAVGSFVADIGYLGGTSSTNTAAIGTTGVVSPAPEAVYQRYRFGNFSYTLGSLTPGASYKVRLHFAELYWTAAGSRTSNVTINGTQVLTNFDVYAAAGGKDKAVIREFTVTANASGQVVITFATTKDNAICNGIEIRIPVPAVPGALNASTASSQIVLTWNAAAGAGNYNIKRSHTSGGPYATIAGSASTTFTDPGATAGTTWYYVVTGVNGNGESAHSNETSALVTGTPLDQWRMSQFGTTNPNDPLAGNLATPQGDGVSNLIKYALGLDPHQPAASGLPSTAIAGGSFTFTFTRMKVATDIVYHVDASGSPTSWAEIWNSSSVPYGCGAAASEQVVVPDVVPVASAPDGNRFMRLRVTTAP
ncbi:MAG: glycosyl hydrolase [Verrucomicrobiota bacterium]